jgi:Uncharacterised nucleotidyltransferase
MFSRLATTLGMRSMRPPPVDLDPRPCYPHDGQPEYLRSHEPRPKCYIMPATARHPAPASASRLPDRGDPARILPRLLATVPEAPAQFQRLCAEVTDWSPVLECAGRHGVEHLLYHLFAAASCDLPPAIREHARRRGVFERLGQTRLLDALDQALAALDGAGVPAVALKGPVLAERLYPDPTIRSSTDLDFLVSPQLLDRASEVLRAIGYETQMGPLHRYNRTHHHHVCLERPGWPMVELHFRAYTGFGIVVPAEPFLSRASHYRTRRGSVAWVLSPEDEFLQLSLHAAGHRFARLSWLFELKLLLQSCPELDWDLVATRARALEIVTPVSFACEMLRRRLAVAVPRRSDLAPPRGLRARAAEALLPGDASDAVRREWETLCGIAYWVILCDRPAASVQLASHALLRIARRRAHRTFPGLVPEDWSG